MNKNFYLLMSSRISSNIGDSIFYVFMMWYIYTSFSSEYWLGIAGVMFTLPSIFGFIWGPVIDRYSPQKIYLFISMVQFLIILSFIIYQLVTTPIISLILLFIFLMSITTELTYPLESVMIPRTVSQESMYKANSYMSISDNTVDMIANGLSGIMLSLFSVMIILNINMVLFLLPLIFISFIRLKKIRVSKEKEYTFKASLKEGIRFTFKRKIVNLILPLVIVNFSFSMVLVSLPVFSDKIYGPEFYGIILMTFGIGSILGAVLVNTLINRFSFKTLTISCFFLAGTSWILMVIFSHKSIVLTIVLIILAYTFIGIINVMYTTLFQVIPTENLIGRVNTIVESLISSAMPLGSFLGGVLLVKYDVNNIVSLFGILLLVISIIYMYVIKKGDYDEELLIEDSE